MADDFEQNQQEEQQGEQGERMFTQEEVDNLINQRLARERRGMPKAEELAAFRAWQKDHPADPATPEKKDEDDSELEIVRRENHLLKQGVPADDVDYYVYKISKLVDENTSFEDAAKKFLKENKRSVVRMDTGARLNGNGGNSGKSANETMNELLRKARG